jgi:hypothetical protein
MGQRYIANGGRLVGTWRWICDEIIQSDLDRYNEKRARTNRAELWHFNWRVTLLKHFQFRRCRRLAFNFRGDAFLVRPAPAFDASGT